MQTSIGECKQGERTGKHKVMLLFVLLCHTLLRFKSGDFTAALEHYTASLSLHPSDAKVLSNRAASYHKLLMWPQCVQVDRARELLCLPGL